MDRPKDESLEELLEQVRSVKEGKSVTVQEKSLAEREIWAAVYAAAYVGHRRDYGSTAARCHESGKYIADEALEAYRKDNGK